MPSTDNTVVDKMQKELKGCPQAPSLNFCSHLPAVFITYDLSLVNEIDPIPSSGQLRRVRETLSKQLNTRTVITGLRSLKEINKVQSLGIQGESTQEGMNPGTCAEPSR